MGPAPLPDCCDSGPVNVPVPTTAVGSSGSVRSSSPTGPGVETSTTAEAQSTFTLDTSNMADTTGNDDNKLKQLQTFKSELQKQIEKPLAKGDAWYLIDNHWFKQLKKYVGLQDSGGGGEVGDESAHPGPVDNKPLFNDEGTDIRDHMIDELDYALVPDEAWDMIVKMFGVSEGQEPVKRKVVEHGMFVKHCKVEVYFIEFQLAENSSLEDIKKKKFSKSDTLEHIQNVMRTEFNIGSDADTRLWNKYSSNTYEQLNRLDNTVQDAGLFSGQMIIIEVKNEDGTWPRQARSTSSLVATNGSTSPIPAPPPQPMVNGTDKKETSPLSSGASTSKYSFTGASFGDGGVSDKAQPGICGLSNLGNTCFMNCIIQCLSNTPAITEYFDNDNYLEDINEDNPLGMKGEIARTFGQLIKDMWSGRYSYVVPRAFKMAVGRFAPQFSGYQQQDSQELLTFLLDGLHEDLNRVKQKPYVEMGDGDGKSDAVVAMEAWTNYKKRNDSVILDIFHGLLKSTVVCPECPKVSVTFDPTCYLSLPLPVKKERQVELFLVYLDPTKPPTQFKVTCPKNGVMKELCHALAKLANVSAESLVVTDVYTHRFHKIYTNDDQISSIMDRDDIFVYETDNTNKDMVTVPVYLREKKTGSSYAPTNLFGQPLLVSLPQSTTVGALYEALLTKMSRYVTRPSSEDEWWKPPPKSETSDSMDQGDSSSAGGSSEESPTSENVASANDDDDMLSDEEEQVGPVKLFTFHLVNSYGSAQIEPIDSSADQSSVTLTAKNYLSLDWHPRAKTKFFNEKTAEDFSQDDSWHGKVAPKKQVIKLSECLKLYTSCEKLGADDAWYCPNCQKHQQATKKFDLWSLPEVLVIHLKRFSYNRYWRDKIDTIIEFPVKNLDMTPYVINSAHGQAVYDLIGVSNHYGGMGGGHYTAYAQNKIDNNWYYFDDSSVTQTNEEAVVTKAAYVLFYQRRTISKSKKDIPAAAGSAEEATTSTVGSHVNHVNGESVNMNGASGESDEDMDVN